MSLQLVGVTVNKCTAARETGFRDRNIDMGLICASVPHDSPYPLFLGISEIYGRMCNNLNKGNGAPCGGLRY